MEKNATLTVLATENIVTLWMDAKQASIFILFYWFQGIKGHINDEVDLAGITLYKLCKTYTL